MNFETSPSNEAEDIPGFNRERLGIPDEPIGGPLKPNHLITTRIGVKEAGLILDQLKVVHKVSLLVPEVPLGNRGAVAPPEYRIEIMNATDRSQPASEEYVRFVYEAIKEARVPIQRVIPTDPESLQTY
jgi:hypothetical protein